MRRIGARRCVAVMGLCCAAALASQAAAQTGPTVPAASNAPLGLPAASAPSVDASANTPASAPDMPATGTAVPASPTGIAAHVEQPRAYGHVVGDVLQQRILLLQVIDRFYVIFLAS